MSVSREEALNIARLAGFEFKEAELNKITSQLNQVLEYMKKLNEVDTTDIDPLINPHELVNVYRDDIKGISLKHGQVFKNVPVSEDNFFIVPKVIDHD